jgi:4-hydroxybenzoate polyprenyltransferase
MGARRATPVDVAARGYSATEAVAIIRMARTVAGIGGSIAVIRRLEFYVVELTIFSIPLLVAARSLSALYSGTVLEGLVMYFVLYAVGDMANCMADRDLDATYKTRLSRAVYRIGPGKVAALVAVETIVGLGLAVHLSIVTGRWLILTLVVIGVFLGLEYSLGPVHFKRRGLGHLACLWLLLYFLPMLCAGLLVAGPSASVLAVAAAYATVEMGVILINTSEDMIEDRAAGIRTTTVALGLNRTIRLAATMVLIGGAGFCAFWLADYDSNHVRPVGYLAVLVLAVTCGIVGERLVRLAAEVRAARSEDAAMRLVKAHGRLVPVAATLLGWVGVGCALVSLTARGG